MCSKIGTSLATATSTTYGYGATVMREMREDRILPHAVTKYSGTRSLEQPPTDDPTLSDADGDGVVEADELLRGCNPLLRDTDRDGIDDGIESNPAASRTPPFVKDTDGDTIPDGLDAEPFVPNGCVWFGSLPTLPTPGWWMPYAASPDVQ